MHTIYIYVIHIYDMIRDVYTTYISHIGMIYKTVFLPLTIPEQDKKGREFTPGSVTPHLTTSPLCPEVVSRSSAGSIRYKAGVVSIGGCQVS